MTAPQLAWLLPIVLCTLPDGGARAQPRAALRVAVLDFENTSSDRSLDPLGKGLQAFLTTDLSQAQALQLVERARLADVQRELKLGRSGAVDPKTAARVGKLLGASHLIAGTFTVVGSKLRIDCRLFSVENGNVLLAEHSEGDKDAFFEVEKALVKRVLEAIAVEPRPKERAAIMRPETADFGAFQAYSRGVALFDDKRYDEAVAALKDARQRDQDFKLAEVTQAEYERVVAELRTEAAALATQDQAAAHRSDRAESRVEAEAIEKLFARAARKGAAARFERMTALGALARWLSGPRPSPTPPPAIPDLFAEQRLGDTALQQYVAEAISLYPQVPLVPLDVPEALLLQAGAFDAEFTALMARYRAASPGALLRPPGVVVDQVEILPAARADLHLRLYSLILTRNPPREWRRDQLTEIARRYRVATQFDRSTALFKHAAALYEGAERGHALEDLADQIELNQKLSAALKQASSPTARELVELAALSPDYELNELHEGATPRHMRAKRDLRDRHSEPYRSPVLLDKHLVWSFGREKSALVTGPRSDGVRTSELRYFWHQGDADMSENLAIVDGTARRELAARFTVSFTPPADFDPPQVPPPSPSAAAAGIDPRRPGVGVVFGVVHVACCETAGYAVLLLPDAVRLVRLVENPQQLKAHEYYAKKLLEEQRLSLGTRELSRVSVRVTSTAVEVVVDGKTIRFRAPADRDGFYGFYAGGHGYAAFRDVVVTPGAATQ